MASSAADGAAIGEAVMGFNAHTGWAALVAITGATAAPLILDRRRVEMIAGSAPDRPPFVYHAARKLSLRAAERFVDDAAELAEARARSAVAAAVAALAARQYRVVACGIVVGNQPLDASLQTILASHSLVHAAEGALFRHAIERASAALAIPVIEVRARELQVQAAALLGISVAALPERLATIGRVAGRPWAKDQKASLLVALLARRRCRA